jgi:hypothetical protein
MSTRNLPGGKERAARKADNITAICEPVVKMWEPRPLTILWATSACYRNSFTLRGTTDFGALYYTRVTETI